MKRQFNGEITVEIHRANGKVEKLNDGLPIHNLPSNDLLAHASRYNLGASMIDISCYSARIATAIAGTWNISGTALTRASGSATLSNNRAVKLSNGYFGYVVSGSAPNWVVSRSGAVAAGLTLVEYNTSLAANSTTNREQIKGSISAIGQAYSAGTITLGPMSSQAVDAVVTPYTLRRITIRFNTTGSGGCHFDLPVDVSMGAGDQVVVTSFTFTWVFDIHAPRAFVSGFVGNVAVSGTIQRLLPVTDIENTGNPTRIFLINAANLYTVPNMSTATINPGTAFTAYETITVTGATQAPAVSNDWTEASSNFGAIVTGSATTRQIVWGTATKAYGIITFDSDVNLTPGQVVNCAGSLHIVPQTP
jgi:hypothetical protein